MTRPALDLNHRHDLDRLRVLRDREELTDADAERRFAELQRRLSSRRLHPAQRAALTRP